MRRWRRCRSRMGSARPRSWRDRSQDVLDPQADPRTDGRGDGGFALAVSGSDLLLFSTERVSESMFG